MQLRHYQQRAIDSARASLLAGNSSVLLVSPTGSGKGTIASYLVKSCVERGGDAMFIVHRKEIINDVAQRIRAVSPHPMSVYAGSSSRLVSHSKIAVGSVQTLFARGIRPPADLIVWDEAHHCAAMSYMDVWKAYPNAKHVGLTATPERGDGTALGDCFDDMVVVTSPQELQDEGFLVPCDVVAPPDFIKGGIAMCPMEAWQTYAPGTKTILFAKNVEHARGLCEKKMSHPCKSAVITGETPSSERDLYIRKFVSGHIDVLINVAVLTEGFDCPGTETCIIARPCGTASTYLQMIGRVLRPSPGKEKATLIDLSGSVHKFGLPFEERDFSLEGKPIAIRSDRLRISQCVVCGFVWDSGGLCQRCGGNVVAREESLPEVTHTKMTKIEGTASDWKERREVFRDLCQKAESRGYKLIWAGIKFRERFGFFPNSWLEAHKRGKNSG